MSECNKTRQEVDIERLFTQAEGNLLVILSGQELWAGPRRFVSMVSIVKCINDLLCVFGLNSETCVKDNNKKNRVEKVLSQVQIE